MNLVEVLVAAVLLAGASSGSLQIWAGSVAASRAAEQRQEQLVLLDGALLAAQEQLQQGAPSSAGADCSLAAAWMAAELEQAPLPEGVARQVEAQAGGVWLRLQTPGMPQRQRWLDAAAAGYCTPAPASAPDPSLEAGGDGTTV